jgi:hypothetical protein
MLKLNNLGTGALNGRPLMTRGCSSKRRSGGLGDEGHVVTSGGSAPPEGNAVLRVL